MPPDGLAAISGWTTLSPWGLFEIFSPSVPFQSGSLVAAMATPVTTTIINNAIIQARPR
jgi:hypothetical protein